MALDAGLQTFFVPAAAAATTGQVTTSTGIKFEIPIFEPLDLHEVGFLCTVATDADTLAVTFSKRPTPASGTGLAVMATLTGPTATIIAAGTILRTFVTSTASVTKRLEKGDCVVINVTDATGAGSGFFYIKGYPAGQSTSQAGDLVSTT